MFRGAFRRGLTRAGANSIQRQMKGGGGGGDGGGWGCGLTIIIVSVFLLAMTGGEAFPLVGIFIFAGFLLMVKRK